MKGQELGFAGGRLKSVAEPWLCEDISRLGGIRLDLLTKLVDKNVQIFDFATIVWYPNGLENLCMGNRDVWVRDQTVENLELFGSQAQVTAANRNMMIPQVYLYLTERDHTSSLARR